jgi:hypothetical protein
MSSKAGNASDVVLQLSFRGGIDFEDTGGPSRLARSKRFDRIHDGDVGRKAMKINRGRLAAAISGALALLVGALVAFEWREIAVRYHIWRLDRAGTEAEARPWLEELASDSKKPEVAEFIIHNLGLSRRNLTFWVFCYCSSFSGESFTRSRRANAELGACLPLLREASRRLQADDSLLASWAHFLRWRKSRLISLILARTEDPPLFGFGEEAYLLCGYIEFLGALWILNIDDRPHCPEFSDSMRLMPLLMSLAEEWKKRFKERLESCRFDPEAGRFVPRRELDPPEVVPDVASPLPGWSGPLPAVGKVFKP